MLRLEEKRSLAGPDLAPGFEAYNFETVYEEFKSMRREVQVGMHDLPPHVALKVWRCVNIALPSGVFDTQIQFTCMFYAGVIL